jgi:hypothetical protein
MAPPFFDSVRAIHAHLTDHPDLRSDRRLCAAKSPVNGGKKTVQEKCGSDIVTHNILYTLLITRSMAAPGR